MIRPLCKIYGGSFYYRDWIISKFPTNYQQLTYLECCLGGGSVLLNKLPSVIEIANDIDWPLINLWQHIKYNQYGFIQSLQHANYSLKQFESTLVTLENYNTPGYFDNWDHVGSGTTTESSWAYHEMLSRRFSRGGMKKTFSKSNRLRGGQMGDKNAWETFVNKELPKIFDRIKNVTFTNHSCIDVVKEYNNKDCLIYCDPPWYSSTRTAKKVYDNEMSNDQHVELLDTILDSKASILILGRSCPLYDKMLQKWHKHTRYVVNNSSQAKTKKHTEICLWTSYDSTTL